MADRKTKKNLEKFNKRLQTLRQQLAGAKRQMDDPTDVSRLEKEISEVEAEVKKLKES